MKEEGVGQLLGILEVVMEGMMEASVIVGQVLE